jgi:acyl carrier protein
MSEFESEVLAVIQDALMLAEIPSTFTADADLFGTFGLDSVDALEIVMALKRRYGVEFSAEDEKNKAVFRSLRELAAHVASRRPASA